ncbi:MAG: membrane protein insertase YidC [Paludibacteraceae bacterium]|nr:membrane protein insertase YidC [Paludibacteraceae bacterium]
MDRSTLIGFLLIAALLFGFSYYNQPSEEELARRESQRQEQAEKQRREDLARREAEKQAKEEAGQDATISDSLRQVEWGEFAGNTGKPETFYTIENNKIRLTVSSRGGQIAKAELKEFTTNAKEPLFLFDKEKDGTCFSVTLLTQNDRVIETKDLDFEPVDYKPGLVDTDSATYTFRVKTSQGAILDYVYTLRQDDYMVGFEIKTEGMGNVLRRNVSDVQVKWTSKIKQQERSKKFEDRYARIYYKPASDDVEKMSPTSDDEEDLTTKVKWIAFKDQFFSSILIADEAMTSAKIRSKMIENDPVYLKKYDADINMPFDLQKEVAAGFHFYFGPNKFQTLKAYDKGVEGDEKLHLEEVIQLGWAIFGWINKYVIIPMFNFFSQYISSMGIIILIMTIIIKLVIMPLTYKSYLSTAKMRVLKPQIEEINKKYQGQEKMQERQQATMALYREAGVNPMGGCLPMLLQMPVLFAMFTFFPAAIELRQQSFLWAEDLSSYDAIVSWDLQIPFVSSWFGNHLSLFCLLMTVTNIIYTYINSKTTETGQAQMPGMKAMMYLMPIMFLFIFNDYASGLSYYYFISTLFSILTTLIFRLSINEEKLLAKMKAYAKNPKKKSKSKWQMKLEEMQKRQQEMIRENAKQRAKRR